MKWLFLTCCFFVGCSEHKPAVNHVPDTTKFFIDCDLVTYVKNDGYKHFLCSAIDGKQYEVLIRRH